MTNKAFAILANEQVLKRHKNLNPLKNWSHCVWHPEFRERNLSFIVVLQLELPVSVPKQCAAFFQDHGTGALVISSLLDFLTFALCAPYSETTEGQQFDMLLEMVASNGRTLFKLFQVSLSDDCMKTCCFPTLAVQAQYFRAMPVLCTRQASATELSPQLDQSVKQCVCASMWQYSLDMTVSEMFNLQLSWCFALLMLLTAVVYTFRCSEKLPFFEGGVGLKFPFFTNVQII